MTPLLLIRPLDRSDIIDAAHVVALAFAENGIVPARYQPYPVLRRLQASVSGGPERFLVAEEAGEIVAVGGFAPAGLAAATWIVGLTATRTDRQGQGVGHRLFLGLWREIRGLSPQGGIVIVSARQPRRFVRYGFQGGPVNPSTGAVMMWTQIPPMADGVAQ